jgi:hypothetical protein
MKYLGINFIVETKELFMKTINYRREKSKKISEYGKTSHAHGLVESKL